LLPVWLGHSPAIPLVHAMGLRALGEAALRVRLFQIPEESPEGVSSRNNISSRPDSAAMDWMDGSFATGASS
jgi:hypothetical protein